jgi:hypothetical protein
MAFFCVVVILGGRKPCVVLCIVSLELATSVVVLIRRFPVVVANLALSVLDAPVSNAKTFKAFTNRFPPLEAKVTELGANDKELFEF